MIGSGASSSRTGTPAASISCLASTFVAILSIDVGRRADPGDARRGDLAGELGVLGQEAVARVDRVGAAARGSLEDQVHVEVGLGRRVARQVYGVVGLGHERHAGIRVGVDRHRLDAEVAAGLEHAARDLATVGDQESD